MYKLLSINILRRYISTGYITNIRSGAILNFPAYEKSWGAQFHFHLDFTSDGVPKLGSRKKKFFSYVYISKGHPYQFLAESSSSGDFPPG